MGFILNIQDQLSIVAINSFSTFKTEASQISFYVGRTSPGAQLRVPSAGLTNSFLSGRTSLQLLLCGRASPWLLFNTGLIANSEAANYDQFRDCEGVTSRYKVRTKQGRSIVARCTATAHAQVLSSHNTFQLEFIGVISMAECQPPKRRLCFVRNFFYTCMVKK